MTHTSLNNTAVTGWAAMSTAQAAGRAGRPGRRRDPVRPRHPRAAYAQDASNYRQVPIGVVVPRTVDAAVEAIAVCRDFDVPVLSRGGGTSLAGQCCNEAVVIDWTKYCHGLVSVDPEARTAVLQPGAGAGQGQRRAGQLRADGRAEAVHARQLHDRRHDREQLLRGDAPRPTARWSTRCAGWRSSPTTGCACGPARPATPSTSRSSRPGARRPSSTARLRQIRDTHLEQIRTGYPQIPRRVSGYNLDSLLPERGFHVARALVGSESTLVTVLHAEIDLVEIPQVPVAGRARLPRHRHGRRRGAAGGQALPAGCRGPGRRADLAGARGAPGRRDALNKLPEGSGWLMIQFGGDTKAEADDRAQALLDDVNSRGRPSPAARAPTR